MAHKEFDVFVIGTGTAGRRVALKCAEEGLKVAIADKREYGGTCALRGCDPKKVLIGLAEILDRSQKLKSKGITEIPEFSWQDLMEYKESFVEKIPVKTEENLKDRGVSLYHQSPKFLDENTLSVEGKTIKAKKIVIATGNKPRELKIPGMEHALGSEDFLNLKELPESMIFIGAGYIGMELAHLAVRCGVKVTIIEMGPRPLLNFDEDMVGHLQKASEAQGIEFIFNAQVEKIEKLQKNFRVIASQNGKEISAKAEMVFNTAGRVAALDGLDLEKGKVEYSDKGVTVNEYLQSTSNNNLYACGDASNSEGLPLTPLSSQEARVVSTNLTQKGKPAKAHYPPQPYVVFTLPNIAAVGLSEKEAKEEGYDYHVKQKFVPDWFSSRRVNEDFYAFKTIVDKKTGLILGAHLIGPEAAEVINMFVMAICGELSCETIKKMIFAYPTWANEIKGML